ncbi:MAG TPA: ABC transporter permease [Thermoanaerobaculia bacterium]
MTLFQDAHYALRQIAKRPVFSAIVIATLGLGIGANTAVFSILDTVLLRPLPYRHGDRLVHLGARPGAGQQNVQFSVPELADYRRQATTLSIVEHHSMTFSLVGHGEPDRVQTGVVSNDFFRQLGVGVRLGRDFVLADERTGADQVLLLTDRYWRRRFGGDPGIVGQSLRMNGRPITVIGVLPPLPPYPSTDDVFMPTSNCPFRSRPDIIRNRRANMVQLWGRLKPGASLGQAQVEASTILARLRQEYPEVYTDPRLAVPVVPVREEISAGFRTTVLVLFGVVVLVLLITCANVANLTLARMMSREREITLRAALGAGRGRILRQLLTESILVGLLGGIAGLALAAAGMAALRAWVSQVNALGPAVSIDGRVLGFTLAVSVLTGLAFGLLPALQVSRHDLAVALKEGGSQSTAGAGRHHLRNGMIVAQVAISCVLLVMAGLTLQTLANLRAVDPGFRTGNVLTLTITLPFNKYRTPADAKRFFDQLLQGLEARPTVSSAALVSDLPLQGDIGNPSFDIQGAAEEPGRTASFHIASAGFFRTLDIPVLAGRALDARDTDKAPLVVVINRTMAKRYWPHGDPINARIRINGSASGQAPLRTVVGVVGDVRQRGLAEEAGPGFYLPFAQVPSGGMEVLVRTPSDPMTALAEVRSLVARLDPEQPIADVLTLAEVRSQAMASPRLTASLLGLFAGLAFLITAIGIAGVISYSVSERTQEIGIRSALGAQRLDVVGMLVRGGLAVVLAGLVVGIAASALSSRVLASLLYGIRPLDVPTFVVVALFLLVVGFLACLVPARRAVAIEPSIALRS